MTVASAGAGRRHYRLFGLEVASAWALPGLRQTDAGDGAVSVEAATQSEIDRRFSGTDRFPELLRTGDEALTEVRRGRDGDVRIAFMGKAVFHIDPAGTEVRCAVTQPESPEWQRVLLDTVLGTVSLMHGHEALHAAAIATARGVVAIAAGTGGGKTSLAAELIGAGGRLFADDLVFIAVRGDRLLAHPGPGVMNLPASPGPPRLGRRLARLGGEDWVAVEEAAEAPAPLRCVALLERGAIPHGVILAPCPPERLLAHMLDSGGARRVAREAVVSALAASADLVTVRAARDAPPAALAVALERWLRSH